MTTRIILRDNANSDSVPNAAGLDQAELVINTADGRLFTKEVITTEDGLDYIYVLQNTGTQFTRGLISW
jgi:hypothetical protein